ncbi:CXXC-type zinc finger protein 1-like [Pollicipes pollicipes]|uniref:CXXC-type zinc finger protein 1-like n=1 Tax=Pollicipes pollicipes TaxID=41117 RepID=UPI001884948C|nr:CXXC-type zinc finger protein 1-like [Pollicipes pollicipes]
MELTACHRMKKGELAPLERQSKVREHEEGEEEEEEVYCICRSADSTRFMIACDNCEEWYHGDCISVTEREAKHIKRFYCHRCRKRDPELKIRYKDKSRGSRHGDERGEKTERSEKSDRSEKAERSEKADKSEKVDKSEKTDKSEKADRGEKAEKSERSDKSDKGEKRPREERDKHRDSKKAARAERESVPPPQPPPPCVKPSRQGSRYCSDQCGLNLARNRIFQVLPQRIQEWNMTRCVAEDRNMRTLERIRREQLEAQTQLERLTRSHHELDRVVDRGRRGTVDPSALEDDTEEEQHSVHCVTCGHEVATRNAVRHMEKCFGKYESQTSFGSLYQTRVEGFNMFCDFYNAANRTYCKRLRVLCPEHSKNPKVSDDEVCGCPLVADVFTSIGQFCRAPKKKCLKHFSWEKLRRAELDMERVRWAMKMDELLEQERQCRQSMANRAGVLALMLHSTFDHDVMEKVQSQQKKMASKVKVKVS